MKYAFIAKHQLIWPTRAMCHLLGVSASGYYEWHSRAPSRRSVEIARLSSRIREYFEASDRTYGSPRIWRDLVEAGERCGENRVARLMRASGIKARHKRRRSPTDQGVRPECSITPNLLERDFRAEAPNQKWAADFTYVWTQEGWLFVAVTLDLYSCRAVGWSMSSKMTAELVSDALLMALWRRGKPRDLDQGYSHAEACRSLDVGETAMRRWVEQLRLERGGVTPQSKALTPEQQRIPELEAKVNRLEREKAILKKLPRS